MEISLFGWQIRLDRGLDKMELVWEPAEDFSISQNAFECLYLH